MADRRNRFRSYFLNIIFLTIIFCSNFHPSAENRMEINYSNRSLRAIPRNLAAKTTVLDLSHNHISKIHISDFSYLSRLQVLILSHNLIKELDLSTFQYNEDLEYLDVSHNKLQIFSCYPVRSLRHLNIIYNSHADLPVCLKSGNVLKLQYLGLSAKSFQESGLGDLAHLKLNTLVLSLEDLSGYRPENFTVFNAKHLHLIFSPKSDFHVLRNLESGEVRKLGLSNIEGKQFDDLRTFLVKLNKNSALQNLTLNNIKWHWDDFIDLLQTVWYSVIEYFTISGANQLEVPNKINFHYNRTSLSSLTITHTTFTSVYSTPVAMYKLFIDMDITALTLSDAGLIHMLCPSKISNYTYLNFSNNSLTDFVFENCKNLSLLEKLVLKSNQLKKLAKVSLMTKHMKSLKYLDMSQNFLQYEDHGNKCGWSQSLVEIDFSFNMLSKSIFSCLPVSIQRLHLQNNKILAIPKETLQLMALEEINLANNKLADLPGCGQFRSLRLLNIEKNLLVSPSSDFYQTCQGIIKVKAGHNPFLCNCELRSFINLETQGYVKFVDWSDSYTCQYPADLRGTLLKDFHISELACNVTLLIIVVLIVTVVLVATVSFLCIRFDIPWYLKMMWHWTRAKHRIWKSKPQDLLDNICFHAFVSYSERDSDWVKNVLIRNLEKEDGSIWICQHERNFIAGKSIVENIIDCVEKSYKSIFVLSPNFVQSEWCHYELYFAHHKLFSENADGLILVLLDSIPACTIPSRYHMLKSLMARRTYLEWPKEKSKQGLFWANLRAAIQIKLPNNKTVG